MDNQKLSARLSALAEKIDAFLESYLREGELFGPPVWLIPPPWYAFKYRKIDRETNRRLHAHGLPEMTMDFRLRFNTQAGQGLEDCGGYLRRKWFVALGVDHAEYDEWAYSPHHPASPTGKGFVMDKAEQPTITQADELLREIFLHGHSEGWTGNQTRRDVQHVDAEKGWSLYVSNGALEKTKARHRTTSLAAQDGLVEALESAEVILSQYADYLDGISYHELEMHPYIPSVQQARDDVRKALSAIKEQHHD